MTVCQMPKKSRAWTNTGRRGSKLHCTALPAATEGPSNAGEGSQYRVRCRATQRDTSAAKAELRAFFAER